MTRKVLSTTCIGCALLLGAGLRAENPRKGDKLSWAWQAAVRPGVPGVQHRDCSHYPIDAFIAHALEKEGLRPAAAADRATLIRRVTFDLTGLPPTPAEVGAFVRDAAPDAYERVVDRLLASPRYGERWAMYWLDLVRFAESDGFKADDVRPTAWRYRDYVIHALNQDKPYDRFLREQIAGDELYPGDQEALVATAFNRHFPDEYNARNLEQRRQEILNDITDTTSQVVLGLTVGCARCHAHKYDPITQKDYYRLQAFFAAVFPRDDMPLGSAVHLKEYEDRLGVWETQTAELRRRMQALEQPVLAKLVGRDKIKYPREIQEAYDTPAEKRTPYQKQLADLVSKQLVVKSDAMTKAMAPAVRKEWQELAQQMSAYDKLKPRPLAGTLGITDVGPVAPATFLLQRGDWRSKGEEVKPGVFALLDPKPAAISARPSNGAAATTGRGAGRAEWLTRPDNPLTARVIVNRLWQHHFGRGIVGTPSDFGVIGEPPTHPELLDWMACEFMAPSPEPSPPRAEGKVKGGWSLKAMHKLMVTSATYRQSSQWRPDAAKIDP